MTPTGSLSDFRKVWAVRIHTPQAQKRNPLIRGNATHPQRRDEWQGSEQNVQFQTQLFQLSVYLGNIFKDLVDICFSVDLTTSQII
jgi:hypothetical protein